MAGSSIAVVIPTRDRPRLLERCLHHLAKQEGDPPDQVIVVDDGVSHPGADVLTRVANFPQTKCVKNQRPGLNGARNAGFGSAETDVVAFLDDDAVPPPHWLKALREAFARHPGAVAIGGPVIERIEGGSRPMYWCRRCSVTDAQFIPGDTEGPVPLLGGANMAIRVDAMHDIGEFDDRLSGWGDEREWFKRVESAGYQAVNVPDAFVWHVRPAGDARFIHRTRRSFQRGREARELYRLIDEPVPILDVIRPLPRYFGHSLRRGCIFGVVAVAGAVGLMVGGSGHELEIRSRLLAKVDPG